MNKRDCNLTKGVFLLSQRRIMKEIEQITDIDNKRYWLSQMINVDSGFMWKTTRDRLDFAELFLIRLPVTWTICRNRQIDFEWARQWESQHGEWKHTGGPHNDLGMAFAYGATCSSGITDFHLSDSPDFGFKFGNKSVRGDIGTCSCIALMNALRSMIGFHNLWISVLGYRMQIILELGYSPCDYIGNNVDYNLVGKVVDRGQALMDTFFCPDCHKWTVTKKTRDLLWKDDTKKSPFPNTQMSFMDW